MNTQPNLKALDCGMDPSSVSYSGQWSKWLLTSWLRALGVEKPLGLCSGFRLDDPTYSIHNPFYDFFFFAFHFFLCFFIFLFLVGVQRQSSFVKVSHHLGG